MIWTLAFWTGAGERALKTFIQTFIPALLLGIGVTDGATLNVFGVDWSSALVGSLGIALGATFLSLCTSIGNASFTAGATPIVSTTAATPADVAVIASVPATIDAISAPVDRTAPGAIEGSVDAAGNPAS